MILSLHLNLGHERLYNVDSLHFPANGSCCRHLQVYFCVKNVGEKKRKNHSDSVQSTLQYWWSMPEALSAYVTAAFKSMYSHACTCPTNDSLCVNNQCQQQLWNDFGFDRDRCFTYIYRNKNTFSELLFFSLYLPGTTQMNKMCQIQKLKQNKTKNMSVLSQLWYDKTHILSMEVAGDSHLENTLIGCQWLSIVRIYSQQLYFILGAYWLMNLEC